MFINDECKTIIVNCIADANVKVASCKAVFKHCPFFPRQPVQLLLEAISVVGCDIIQSSSKQTCFRRNVELTVTKDRAV